MRKLVVSLAGLTKVSSSIEELMVIKGNPRALAVMFANRSRVRYGWNPAENIS